MKDTNHEMKNMSYCWFLEFDIQVTLKCMYAQLLKVASRTQETEMCVCEHTY